MISVFRRIRRKLFTESKFGRYATYAIGEIALVVIGILIALQINNWNEFAKERRVEEVVLEDIKDNIERNDELIRNAIEVINEINRATDKVKNIIENKSPYTDTIGIQIYQALRIGTFLFKLNFDGYESLKSTGFNIVQNEELKDEILGLFEVRYGYVMTTREFANSFYLENLSWWKDYFYQPDDINYLPYNKEQFFNDKRLLTEMNEIIFIRNDFRAAIENSLRHSQRVLDLINKELEAFSN